MVGLAGFAPATRDVFHAAKLGLTHRLMFACLYYYFGEKTCYYSFFFVVIFCEVGKIMENNKARDEHAYLSVMQRFTDNRFLL